MFKSFIFVEFVSDNLKVNEFRVSNTLFLFVHQYNKKIHLFILIKNNKNYSKKKKLHKKYKEDHRTYF